jgi:hypothetical protein
VWIIRSPKVIDSPDAPDPDAPDAAKLPARFVKTGEVELDGDVIAEHLDRESDLFFAASASSDIVGLHREGRSHG